MVECGVVCVVVEAVDEQGESLPCPVFAETNSIYLYIYI